MIYTAGPVRNVFDAGRYIMWASGGGGLARFGPRNRELFGPCEMASSRSSVIWGPKTCVHQNQDG